MEKATFAQYLKIGSMIEAGKLSQELAQALIEGRVEIVSDKKNLITVPALPASELIAEANKKLDLNYLDEAGYASYDFVRDEGGKTYEVLVWKPGRAVETKEVPKHFSDLGFDGNAAAFVAWVTEHNPEGYHASIPSDDVRLFRLPESSLFAPYFYRDDDHRSLDLRYVRDEWDAGWSFVAFREVMST